MIITYFFFFSSRRRHTRSLCDWSSDVCSSDLDIRPLAQRRQGEANYVEAVVEIRPEAPDGDLLLQRAVAGHDQPGAHRLRLVRSEERRVGKECRFRRGPDHYNKN